MTPLNHNLYAVEVPEDLSHIVFNYVWVGIDGDAYATCGQLDIHIVNLPKDYEYTAIGTVTNGVVDFDCEGLVGKAKHYTWRGYGTSTIEDMYLDYLHIDKAVCRTAVQSFRSLLQSKNLDTNKRYLIIQKQ